MREFFAAAFLLLAATVAAAQPTPHMRFDFDGDGRADLLFQGLDGHVEMLPTTGGARVPVREAGAAYVLLVGDLDGDARADILWSEADGSVSAWRMAGATATSKSTLVPAGTGWTPRLLADVNGDGRMDIVWKHTDGSVAVWLMNGGMVGGARLLAGGTGWEISGTADFDGDGKADLVWSHPDGRAAVWLMDGTRQAGGGLLLAAGTGWRFAEAADFDANGRADIVWTHGDGRAAIWMMDGARQVGGRLLVGPGTGWTFAATGRFNGDANADLFWRSAEGDGGWWYMNGTAQVGGARVRGFAAPARKLQFIGDAQGSGTESIWFDDVVDSLVPVSNLRVGTALATPEWVGIKLPTLGGSTTAHDINEAELVVGNATTPSGATHGVMWRNGAIIDLGADFWPLRVNDNELMVGVTPAGEMAFRQGATVTRTGVTAYANDMNNSGWVAGWRPTATSSSRAFLYRDGAFIDLGNLCPDPAGTSTAQGINEAGQVVGYCNIGQPFIYENGAMRIQPQPAEGSFSFFVDINDRGEVLGYGSFRGPAPFVMSLATAQPTWFGSFAGPEAFNNTGFWVGDAEGSHAYVCVNGGTSCRNVSSMPGVTASNVHVEAINDRGSMAANVLNDGAFLVRHR